MGRSEPSFCSKLSTPHPQPANSYVPWLARLCSCRCFARHHHHRYHHHHHHNALSNWAKTEPSSGKTDTERDVFLALTYFLQLCFCFALLYPCFHLLCLPIFECGTRSPVFFVLLQYPGLQCLTCSFSSPTPTPGSPFRPGQESHRPPQVDPDVDWPHALSPAQHISPAVARPLLTTKPLLLRAIVTHSLPHLSLAAALGCQESLPTGLCPASLAFPTASLQPGCPKVELARNPQTW